MNGLRHIQESPLQLVEAGGDASQLRPQLLSLEGNSCPELWNHAMSLWDAACKEMDNKEHHRKLMEAGQAFVQVVLAPGHHPIEKSFALNNVGLIMQALGKMEEAYKAFGFAIQMNPNHPTILQNYATARMVLGDLKDAAEWFYKALDKNPNCAEARWNSALIALTFGDFRRGFINFEWRWKCGTFTWRRLKTKRPQWNGQDLKGKTILLTHEQGFGDSIQFIRYAKMVKALGPAKVRYLCLPELVCILKDVEGIDSVTEFADINRDGSAGDEDFDYHCPLLSLPRIFKTRVDSVPWDGPYIDVSPISDRWLQFANYEGAPLKVGIVWAGRPNHANDKNRSMRVEDFAPLLEIPNITWYSLQVGDRAAEAAGFPKLHSINPWSFADTAWWLSNLDLLISVDTAVVHLAGAMGSPVWTLLPYSADWRWMMDREDSPWYPTMRLFRQSVKGQWSDVIERVRKELCKRAAQPPS